MSTVDRNIIFELTLIFFNTSLRTSLNKEISFISDEVPRVITIKSDSDMSLLLFESFILSFPALSQYSSKPFSRNGRIFFAILPVHFDLYQLLLHHGQKRIKRHSMEDQYGLPYQPLIH